MTTKGTMNVSLPRPLIDKVTKTATSCGLNRSAFVELVLQRHLGGDAVRRQVRNLRKELAGATKLPAASD